MFTGIIEELGIVKAVEFKKNLALLVVEVSKILKGTKLGDSISINGVCLTVTKIKGKQLSFDIMKETLLKTNLGRLKSKDKVNLERALKFGDRLGGHFVTGHIDGMAVIRKKNSKPNFIEVEFSLDKNLKKFLVPKGSICIDGVSLTVGKVKEKSFTVYLIPHTLELTTLGFKRSQDTVNIEADILTKYALAIKTKG